MLWRHQMIERPQEEDDISSVVGEVRRASVADLAGSERPRRRRASATCLRYEAWTSVEEVDGVALPCQPERVRTGTSADIENSGGRGRCVPLDQFPRAQRFEEKRPLRWPAFPGARVLAGGDRTIRPGPVVG